MNITNLKSDKKYKDIFSVTKKELQSIEMLALQDREIYQPLFVWKGQDILIYGYQYLKVLKAHPEVKYTVRELDFESWQEAQVWAVEHYIALPETLLWQKLEAAVQCEGYWLLKADAKKAHGNRQKSPTVSEGDSERSKEVNVIIAQKVGCSTTYVYNFKRIFESGRKDIIALCRKGEMSISKAYSQLFMPKKPRKPKPSPSAPIKLDIDGSKIFDDCENNIDVGNKNTTRHNGLPVDPVPIAEQIQVAKIPDGTIWISLHKNDRQMQVVQRVYDEAKGDFRAKVNAYNCKIVSSSDELIILEADHINGGTSEIVQKDDRDFNESSQMAS